MSDQEVPAPSAPPPRKPGGYRFLSGCLLWAVLPLALGALIAYLAVPRPAVGIIRLNMEIWTDSAEFVSMQIEEARADPRIRAVVVQLDTPGGEVAATQVIYMELLHLRGEMPVVGSIDSVAASGGYYAAMATDPIYAKPSSVVGNVGVWGYFPSTFGVNDVILASGPFKLSASNTDEFLREIEGIKQEFIGTVALARGGRLVISQADLSQGLAYPGREALRLGLVDHLGSQSEAVEEAARQAGIRNYQVIDLQERVIEELLESDTYYITPESIYQWPGTADPLTGNRTLSPGIYLLYDINVGGTR